MTALFVSTNPIDDKASQLVPWGAPVSSVTNPGQYLLRTMYSVHYLYRTNAAEYVCEHCISGFPRHLVSLSFSFSQRMVCLPMQLSNKDNDNINMVDVKYRAVAVNA